MRQQTRASVGKPAGACFFSYPLINETLFESGDGDWSGMTLVTLPQRGSIIDLDSVSFVIRIQNKTGDRGIRIGLGDSELQIITPDDARRFLEELRDSKQVNVENLLKWVRLTPTSVRPPAESRRPPPGPQPESVEK